MGFYIDTPSPVNKAQQICTHYRGVVLHPALDEEFHKTIINDTTNVLLCVVHNGNFDAVRIVIDNRDYDYITQERPDDDRARTFMVMPRAIAKQLCPEAPI